MRLVQKVPGSRRSFIAAVVLTLGVVSVVTAQEKKTLVFVVNGASDFWKAAEAGVKKAQAELPELHLELKYPEQAAAAIQQRLMDDLVPPASTAIMVSAVDPKTSTDGAEQDRRRRCRCSPPTATPRDQPHRLYRLVQRRRRQAGRRDRPEGAARTAASASASSACSAPTMPASASRA